jgi:uncharacterized Zn-finger protein
MCMGFLQYVTGGVYLMHLFLHTLCHRNDTCTAYILCVFNYHKHLRQHSNKKSHKCPICSRGFNDSSNLQSHIRTHTGERPFVCDVCGQGFNQSTTLQMHLRTHTGYKPYTCHFCGKGCARKDALDKHLRSHTGETLNVIGHMCSLSKIFITK